MRNFLTVQHWWEVILSVGGCGHTHLYKAAVLCGNPVTKDHLDPTRRLVASAKVKHAHNQ